MHENNKRADDEWKADLQGTIDYWHKRATTAETALKAIKELTNDEGGNF